MNPTPPLCNRHRRTLLRQLGALSAAGAAALLASGPAAAHHSFALFDQTKTLTIKGVVSRFEWSNPHVAIYLDVPGSPVKRYKVEGPSVNALSRQGWKPNSVKVGAQAEVSFHPLKTGDALGGLLIEIKTGGVVLTVGS